MSKESIGWLIWIAAVILVGLASCHDRADCEAQGGTWMRGTPGKYGEPSGCY